MVVSKKSTKKEVIKKAVKKTVKKTTKKKLVESEPTAEKTAKKKTNGKADFSYLDGMVKLKPSEKKSGKPTGTMDGVGKEMAKQTKTSDIAKLAHSFGITADEIKTRAHKSSGQGQFRMVLLNRMRSIAGRLQKAKKIGLKVTPAEVAYLTSKLKSALKRGVVVGEPA